MKNSVKTLRQQQDWTQEDLAAKLGCSRQTINAIERGRYDPSLTLAFQLAQVFDTRIEAMIFPGGT